MFEINKLETSYLSATSSLPHVMGSASDVLHKVMDPDVNLALWQRPPEKEITDELSALQATDLPDVRHRTSLTSFDDDVCTLFQQQDLNPQHFINLRVDLRQLVDLLGNVSGCREFSFRLVTVAGDECCRFHLDRTPLRLICTYQGSGTEWLPDWQVDREALARSASNEAITRFGEPSQFEPFWVGIMKGDPGKKGQGLVHRSPAVPDSQRFRVLFCIDSTGHT
ncbi:MAG: DUF1826 domain-containing protein [Pseudomonadales bacterium]|nr:DUF1826 domain-containing protein [Pseudomonadales bacterium]